MAQSVLDTTNGRDERWQLVDHEFKARQLAVFLERHPGAPRDSGLAGAFSTSRTDPMYDSCAKQMTDEGLRWALANELVKAGLAKLRREARRRGWSLPRAGHKRG